MSIGSGRGIARLIGPVDQDLNADVSGMAEVWLGKSPKTDSAVGYVWTQWWEVRSRSELGTMTCKEVANQAWCLPQGSQG